MYSADRNSITESQRRRLLRDTWHATAHSRANRKFVEVDGELAASVKVFAQAKSVHMTRERQAGCSFHYACHASLGAFQAGKIHAATC